MSWPASLTRGIVGYRVSTASDFLLRSGQYGNRAYQDAALQRIEREMAIANVREETLSKWPGEK